MNTPSYQFIKYLAILILAFCFASILVGCGGSDDSDSPKQDNPKALGEAIQEEWNSTLPIKCITDTDVETNRECAK
jgi:hypothetical protein